ncbi:TIGR02996 domain-containing protein [Gemmata sp.]|uniref:TIGR02996 domain-containing protein n=1 Tax=Gemmata sp. TaxID=1914242 RepID=UPI003F7016B1
MSDRAFLAKIEEEPAEALHKLAYADWLDEQRRHGLAFAYRWAARRGHHPRVTPGIKRAVWSTFRRGQHKPAWPSQLPPLVFAQLRPLKQVTTTSYAPPNYRCRDMSIAFAALADVLQKLREVIE